jgi:putative heme iron utilization protein
LVYLGRVGSLSTLSRKQQGFPFGSVMPYGSLPRNITAVNPTRWLTLQSAASST